MPSASVFETSHPALRLCREAKEKPEAVAGFVFFQWERLGWPIPDAVIPLPGAKGIAQAFASWLDRPYIPVMLRWDCDIEVLEEDWILLLLAEKQSLQILQSSAEALSEAFPKKIYALSLLS